MTDSTFPVADVLIVGSGPSGVSAAIPLVEAGLRVWMVDGGKQRDPDLLPRGKYHEIRRRDSEQWRYFLGPRLQGLRRDRPPSPKFDAPGSHFAIEGFASSQRILGRNFVVVGSLARGGLSNIWGAGVTLYDRDDLAGFCLSPEDLAVPYSRIARRVGITGFGRDDLSTTLDTQMPGTPPMRLCTNAEILLRRYGTRRERLLADGVKIGRSRAAVLTQPLGDRQECGLCDLCVWGCSREALYSAAQDVRSLLSHPNFRYMGGLLAERISKSGGAYQVHVRALETATAGSPAWTLSAPVLIMAAGTLTTTRLILAYQERLNESVPVVVSPALGFALLLPERIGQAISEGDYSMAQLSFVLEGSDARPGDRSYGSLFPASGLPASLVLQHMPLSRRGAIRLYRLLQPAMLLGNCFLPGHLSANRAHLRRDADGGNTLVIDGGVAPELPERLARTRKVLARAFRGLGAWLIPGSVKPVRPGEDMRYCGTLPMADPARAGGVDRLGELVGHPGLFVADLSSFPTMPAKHHTLTLMANAHRIGAGIAARFSAPATSP